AVARRSVRHHPDAGVPVLHRLAVPVRLGKAGTGRRPQLPPPAPRHGLRRRRGPGVEPGDGRGLDGHRRPCGERTVRPGRARRVAAQHGRRRIVLQRAARGVQPGADSAARRRAGTRRTVAAGTRARGRSFGALRPVDRHRPAAARQSHRPVARADRGPRQCTHRASVLLIAARSQSLVNSATNARVLSGMRPTGALHLGNYHGALRNWIALQYQYECFFFVADWHALTTGYEDTSQLEEHTWQMVVDWLGAGLNPSACTMFIQSKIPEHAELHLLLSMITP